MAENPYDFWTGGGKGSSGGTKTENPYDFWNFKQPGAPASGGKKTPRGVGKVPASNPLADLYGFADQFGSWSGGSSGGGGGGGAAAALLAALAANQNDARRRYKEQKRDIRGIYDDLDDSLEGNPDDTMARYDTLKRESSDAGSQIAAQTMANQAAHDEQRRIALQSLGVNPEAAVNEENQATNEGLSRLAQNNATWTGLQGSLGEAQVGRDNLDISGANDAEVLAQKSLRGSFEDYMRQLDQQRQAAAMSGGGGGGGGGGSAPEYSNPFLDQINKAIFGQMLGNAGLGAQGDPDYSYGLPSLLAAYGTGVGPAGKGLSDSEIIANIGKSSDPQGALGAWAQYIKGRK